MTSEREAYVPIQLPGPLESVPTALQPCILPGDSPLTLPTMAKKFPLHPKHPERICWGCDKYCPTDSLACGNGSGRTLHPAEMLGDDWYSFGDWGLDVAEESNKPEGGSP